MNSNRGDIVCDKLASNFGVCGNSGRNYFGCKEIEVKIRKWTWLECVLNVKTIHFEISTKFHDFWSWTWKEKFKVKTKPSQSIFFISFSTCSSLCEVEQVENEIQKYVFTLNLLSVSIDLCIDCIVMETFHFSLVPQDENWNKKWKKEVIRAFLLSISCRCWLTLILAELWWKYFIFHSFIKLENGTSKRWNNVYFYFQFPIVIDWLVLAVFWWKYFISHSFSTWKMEQLKKWIKTCVLIFNFLSMSIDTRSYLLCCDGKFSFSTRSSWWYMELVNILAI